MSVKSKIVTLFGLLVAISISLLTINNYNNFKTYSSDSTRDSLSLEANLISSVVEQKMSRYFDGLRLMAAEVAMNDAGEIGDIEIIKKQLIKVEKNLNMFGAALGQTDGVTYNSNGVIANFNAKKLGREWYKNAMSDKRNAATIPYLNNVGDLVMSLSVPIKRNGNIVGILNANISVNAISDKVTEVAKKSNIFVNRGDGYLLASNDPEQIGQDLYKIRPSYDAYKNETNSSHIYDFEGESYFVTSSMLPEFGWSVWSWEKIERIEKAVNSNLMQSLIIALILILIALVITYWLVIRLMYLPIGGEPSEIEKLVHRVASGDLTISGVKTGKETGIYAAVFVMVEALKSSLERINQAASDLTESADKTSVAASDLNQSSEAQMNHLEQTSTAMNEMTITVQDVTTNAFNASTAAQEAFQHSETGILIVNAMNDDINNLVKGIENVVQVNSQLEVETQSIGSILGVINSISEQTNLLALNAAIEAARAGEHGRGFAVVADEVRSLANRTQHSTNEIQDMINKLQAQTKNLLELMNINMQKAEDTVEKSDNANNALAAIRTSVTLIDEMNTQIATAAEEQTNVSSEVNLSIIDINDAAKITFKLSEENNESAKTLTEIAMSLRKSVEFFHY
ncbi:methyl-accepting chemotaxis protein [Vibrio sp. DW001]|uniref:methyl-accepting chemotaxis protein n=1 Tax=Vibrio sp. DW001 TaxID=2912315 RepID=UPI0023B01CA7|nr:methyl-accepting chemotaxis protein [Vibrio sp. DW001]WED28766.1 methyl-accepting chemotaxis protein [Vibrio sp. DW001]